MKYVNDVDLLAVFSGSFWWDGRGGAASMLEPHWEHWCPPLGPPEASNV